MGLRVGRRGGARALVTTLGLMAALGSAAAQAQDRASPFHCDGTDLALFLERQEAGWLGYGETWDHDTCAEGTTTIYAPGARQWADMRPKWSLAVRPKVNAELYATVFPLVGLGGIVAVVGIAWLIAFVQRRRRVRVATLSCPSCANELPVTLDDPAMRNLFCPACGAPCVLVEEKRGAVDVAPGAA